MGVQEKLVGNAAAAVKDEFEASKDLQAKALNQALDSIADSSFKHETDVVGALFTKYFQGYKKAVEHSQGEVDIPADVLASAADERAGGARASRPPPCVAFPPSTGWAHGPQAMAGRRAVAAVAPWAAAAAPPAQAGHGAR